jgi:hypothetical protein
VIASFRGLAVLAALAVALGVAVLVGPSSRPSTDRSLTPHVALDAVTSITVAHAGTPAVQLVREADGWHWTSDRAHAETATVDAILSTLRGAHWHRRAAKSVAQPVTAELRLDGAKPLALSRGRDVAAAAQTWLVRGNDALLVDSWVAAALFPAPLALRVAHPMAAASQATTIMAGPLRLDGTHRVTPDSLWVDPGAITRLTTALANLEVVALPPSTAALPAGNGADTIEVAGSEHASVARVGTCDGSRVLVQTTSGAGCVDGAAWQAVIDALAPLRATGATGTGAAGAIGDDIVDLRPLPIEPVQITFGDGTVLSLASPPRIGDVDADRQRVEELVGALAARGTRVARPAGAPRTTLIARDRAGSDVVLEVFDTAIARRGEPFAITIALDASVRAIIARPGAALRDPVRWREDATTLSSLTLGGTTYTRGAVIGEWTRAPAGPVDAALVDALASALAIVRAPDDKTAAALPLSIHVTFTPPAGKPTTHELSLGAPTQDGCPARIDGVAVRADLELCTAAHALAGR